MQKSNSQIKKIFVDCNIVYDLLIKRAPYYDDAADLFDQCVEAPHELYLSALTFSQISYFLSKVKHINILTVLKDFRKLIKISSVDQNMIDDALASKFTDFEDAVQYYSASSIHADYIVTRNIKDFKHSKIKVISPKEFLKLI